MEITKIKFDGGRTIVNYNEMLPQQNIDKEIVFKSDNPRHEDFENVRAGIVPLALGMLELPAEYARSQEDSNAPTVELLSCSFTYNDTQGFGAVCTLVKDLKGYNAPFVMNTPHAVTDGDQSLLPTALYNEIQRLIKQAEAFIAGKSAQGNLFDKPQDEQPDESPSDQHYGAIIQAAHTLVLTSGKPSVSFIQRELGIGYATAERVMQHLELIGVVSAPNHVGKRTVLATEGGAA